MSKSIILSVHIFSSALIVFGSTAHAQIPDANQLEAGIDPIECTEENPEVPGNPYAVRQDKPGVGACRNPNIIAGDSLNGQKGDDPDVPRCTTLPGGSSADLFEIQATATGTATFEVFAYGAAVQPEGDLNMQLIFRGIERDRGYVRNGTGRPQTMKIETGFSARMRDNDFDWLRVQKGNYRTHHFFGGKVCVSGTAFPVVRPRNGRGE